MAKSESNRVQAFEEYAKDLMKNQDVLVGSRIISLDSVTKIVQSIHTMIGAPKKKEDDGEEDDALGHLADWLSGGNVAAFAKAGEIKLPPLEPDGLTEEIEIEAEDEEVEAENGG